MADKITCPNCGITAMIGKDAEGDENAMIDYYVDNKGVFNWECFECNHQWKGNYKGEKIDDK